MLYFYSVFIIFRELHINPNLVFGGVSRREMEEVIYSDINIKMWGQTSHFYNVTKVIKYLQIYLLTWQHLYIELAKKSVPICSPVCVAQALSSEDAVWKFYEHLFWLLTFRLSQAIKRRKLCFFSHQLTEVWAYLPSSENGI